MDRRCPARAAITSANRLFRRRLRPSHHSDLILSTSCVQPAAFRACSLRVFHAAQALLSRRNNSGLSRLTGLCCRGSAVSGGGGSGSGRYVYAQMGPACSVMARKFLPGAAPALLAGAADCDGLGFDRSCMP